MEMRRNHGRMMGGISSKQTREITLKKRILCMLINYNLIQGEGTVLQVPRCFSSLFFFFFRFLILCAKFMADVNFLELSCFSVLSMLFPPPKVLPVFKNFQFYQGHFHPVKFFLFSLFQFCQCYLILSSSFSSSFFSSIYVLSSPHIFFTCS